MPTPIETAAQYFENGNLQAANAECDKILESDSSNVNALHLNGVIAYQRKDYLSAIEYLSSADTIAQTNIEIKFALAASYENNEQVPLAITAYRTITSLAPQHIPARKQLATLLSQTNEYQLALNEFSTILNIDPNNLDVLLAIAKQHAELEEYERAAIIANKLLNTNNMKANFWNDLGLLFASLNELDHAIKCFEKSHKLDSGLINCQLNLASALQRNHCLEDAKNQYIRTLSEIANQDEFQIQYEKANYNLALIYLAEGHYQLAWQHLIKRPKKCHDLPSKTDLCNKKILVLGEEGIGDELTFLRFLRPLKLLNVEVDYVGSTKLKPLLENSDLIHSYYLTLPNPENYHYHISLMDLPYILDCTDIQYVQPLSLTPNYNLEHPIINKVKQSLLPKIGITWKAGATNTAISDKWLQKSLPIEVLSKIISKQDCLVVILQRNPNPEDIAYLHNHTKAKIIDASELNEQLDHMLLLLKHLDRYITVSNTNVHLFGALQKKCDVIVPFPGEWRWMDKGDRSPWYPNFTVHRQTKPNSWDSILDTIQ